MILHPKTCTVLILRLYAVFPFIVHYENTFFSKRLFWAVTVSDSKGAVSYEGGSEKKLGYQTAPTSKRPKTLSCSNLHFFPSRLKTPLFSSMPSSSASWTTHSHCWSYFELAGHTFYCPDPVIFYLCMSILFSIVRWHYNSNEVSNFCLEFKLFLKLQQF